MSEQAQVTTSWWNRAKTRAGIIASATWDSLITWSWTKTVVHWLIVSAGTASELVFIAASIWVSLNANVHGFILGLGISEATTRQWTEMSTAAYVALPEFIVCLAVITTISHVRVWAYNKKDYRAGIWSLLFGIPTFVFVVLSLFTLGSAVANVNFQMPILFVITRALAGYVYAFSSLLYTYIGKPQERDRLEEKDVKISQLQSEMKSKVLEWESEKHRLNAEIANQKALLEKSKRQNETLEKAVIKSAEEGLEAYSQECKTWLNSGAKSVKVDAITQYTGHSKRKVTSAIDSGNLQTSPRNKELILVSSLVEWLKDNPPQSGKIVALKQPHGEINTDELEAVSM